MNSTMGVLEGGQGRCCGDFPKVLPEGGLVTLTKECAIPGGKKLV